MTNPSKIQAAAKRVEAADHFSDAFDAPESVLSEVFAALPEMKHEVIKRNWVTLGIYEWDDLDLDENQIKEALIKAGLKFIKSSEDALHFEVEGHFVVFAPNMGVVMAGSL